MDTVLTLDHFSKIYPNGRGARNITFSVERGQVVGLLGPNGSGKTTIMKSITGLAQPSEGTITVFGANVAHREQALAKVGALIEQPALYEHLTAQDHLRMAARYYRDVDQDRMDRVLEIVGLAPYKKERCGKFSLGMKQRMGLALALLSQPELMILDEPTNGLDIESIDWLEEFLMDYPGTIIVVSHDRHFLNAVCTHIVDIDYNKVQMYAGNYDFWYESSQLMQQLIRNQNKKKEEKIRDLQNFIQRFSANKSKSKQATSRKKILDSITLEEMPASSRKYPYVGFEPEREAGKDILFVEGITKTVDGVKVLDNVSFIANKGDKIALVGENEAGQTALFKILTGEMEPDAGSFKWGVSTSQSYFPQDNSAFFEGFDEDLICWLRQYSEDTTETYLRGFLGRMLFSGDEVYKPAKVLSGGEKVRCMLSRMMMTHANVLLLDQPTNHLDLESIQALADGLARFPGNLLFSSHDHQFIDEIANRIIELPLGQPGCLDRTGTYEEFLEWKHNR